MEKDSGKHWATVTHAIERFRAFIVGIDTYQVGPKWTLHGAEADAIRFAEWLLECGVPPQSMDLFLSPRSDRASALKGKPLESVQRWDATLADFRKAVKERLMDNPPQDFCLFWAGHGVIRDGDDTHLFFADAQRSDMCCLNLKNLLQFFMRSGVGGNDPQKMRRCVAIADACSVFAQPEVECDISSISYPLKRRRVKDRSYSGLIASRPGESAREVVEQKTGLFSRELHALLPRRNLEVLFDLEPIRKKLEERFRVLCTTERNLRQLPSYFEFKQQEAGDWIRKPCSWQKQCLTPTPGELEQLEKLTDGMQPPVTRDRAREAFHLSLPGGDLYDNEVDVENPLKSCIRTLAQKAQRGALFTFLELCRLEFTKAGIQKKMDAWIAKVAGRLDIDHSKVRRVARNASKRLSRTVSGAESADRKPGVLQIVVEPLEGQVGGREEYQLYLATCEQEGQGCTQLDRSEELASGSAGVRQLIRDLFSLAHRRLREVPCIRIEAVLPAELLAEGADDWLVPSGAKPAPLGSDFHVALRSYEREYKESYLTPRKKAALKWEQLAGQTDCSASVVWLDKLEDIEADTFYQWDDDRALALCAMSLDFPDVQKRTECVQDLVSAGIPLAAWFKDSPGSMLEGKSMLHEHFVVKPLWDWPGKARELRKQKKRGGAGAHVAVLWDNPAQPLPVLPGPTLGQFKAPQTGIKMP